MGLLDVRLIVTFRPLIETYVAAFSPVLIVALTEYFNVPHIGEIGEITAG